MCSPNGDLKMARSRLRTWIVILVVFAATGTIYTLSRGTPNSANAAQPSSRTAALLTGPCWHVGVSDWTCPDSTMYVRSADNVTTVSVTVETRDGKKLTARLPAGVDAIFLTKEATEKFLLSYYWATNKVKAEGLTRKLATIREANTR